MSEQLNEETPEVEETEVETPQAPAGIDPQRFESLERNVQALVQRLSQPEEEEYEEEDETQLAPAELLHRAIDSRFNAYRPALEAVAQERGEKVFNDMVTQIEGRPELKGVKVDRQLAYAFAEQAAAEGYNPEQAVYVGVTRAAEYVNNTKKSAIDEYKKSLTRRAPGDGDLQGGAGGNRKVPEAKSYDEVIERWSSQLPVD